MTDNSHPTATAYLPAGRYDALKISLQRELFAPDDITGVMLDAVPSPLLVINAMRQIVFANAAVTAMLGYETIDELMGMRTGEAFHCTMSTVNLGGCGTSEGCRWCEVVSVIMAALNGEEVVTECRLTCKLDGQERPLDLRAWGRPLTLDEESFVILSLLDISHEQRRKALEHTFFHDLMNSLGSVKGLLELIKATEATEQGELFELMEVATTQAIEEISSQQMLLQAESHELRVDMVNFDVQTWLGELIELFRKHHLTGGKRMEWEVATDVRSMLCDRTLLRRILVNMMKNALEATPRGGVVKVVLAHRSGELLFSVHNATAIPPEHQFQIFKRSFSTRGRGRGIGTYSMRLLSSYLGANVSFISTPADGTTFTLACPHLP